MVIARGPNQRLAMPTAVEYTFRLPTGPTKGESMSVAAGTSETEIKTDAPPAQEDAPMVLLTDKAAEKVKEIRGEENIEEGYALRLKVQGGGCSGFSYDLYFDQPQETDRPFEIKGVKLICDEMSLMYLLGTEVDYVEGLHGAGFKFNNPNVKSTCGCGSSFSV
jgi:iron-sulfur cluster assembly accessory protein